MGGVALSSCCVSGVRTTSRVTAELINCPLSVLQRASQSDGSLLAPPTLHMGCNRAHTQEQLGVAQQQGAAGGDTCTAHCATAVLQVCDRKEGAAKHSPDAPIHNLQQPQHSIMHICVFDSIPSTALAAFHGMPTLLLRNTQPAVHSVPPYSLPRPHCVHTERASTNTLLLHNPIIHTQRGAAPDLAGAKRTCNTPVPIPWQFPHLVVGGRRPDNCDCPQAPSAADTRFLSPLQVHEITKRRSEEFKVICMHTVCKERRPRLFAMLCGCGLVCGHDVLYKALEKALMAVQFRAYILGPPSSESTRRSSPRR